MDAAEFAGRPRGAEGRLQQKGETERERMAAELNGHPQIRNVFPGFANFLLLAVLDVEAFLSLLRTNGIIARDRSTDRPDTVRLTLGTPEENDQVLQALS